MAAASSDAVHVHHKHDHATTKSKPRVSTRHTEMAGPYVLGKTLGKGTSGKVVEATHRNNGSKVAVKIIKKDSAENHRKIAREIAVMRLIDQ